MLSGNSSAVWIRAVVGLAAATALGLIVARTIRRLNIGWLTYIFSQKKSKEELPVYGEIEVTDFRLKIRFTKRNSHKKLITLFVTDAQRSSVV